MMRSETYKYLTKGELREANRQALKAGCRAIEPDYIDGLGDNLRFPIFLDIPYERYGWVRCQVGTGVPGKDYTPVVIDVPQGIYENLGTVEIPVDNEVQP